MLRTVNEKATNLKLCSAQTTSQSKQARQEEEEKKNRLKMKQSIVWSLGMGNVHGSFPLRETAKGILSNLVVLCPILFVLYRMFNITQNHNIFVWMSNVQCPVVHIETFSFTTTACELWACVRALSAALYHIDVTLWASKLFFSFFFRFGVFSFCLIRQCMSRANAIRIHSSMMVHHIAHWTVNCTREKKKRKMKPTNTNSFSLVS